MRLVREHPPPIMYRVTPFSTKEVRIASTQHSLSNSEGKPVGRNMAVGSSQIKPNLLTVPINVDDEPPTIKDSCKLLYCLTGPHATPPLRYYVGSEMYARPPLLVWW